MARLRFGRPISLRWNGLLLEGPANTVFEIPDEYYEEFNEDIGPVEPTLVWLDSDEGATLRGRVTALEGAGAISLSNDAALALGTAASGAGAEASRDDHVHPTTGLSLSGHDHSGTYEPVNTSILKSIVDAKGDIIVATAADTVSRLAVGGTDDYVLTVDSSTPTGLSWKIQSGGVPLSNDAALSLGSASAGTGLESSRDDHVHPTTGLALSGHDHDATYVPIADANRADIVFETCKNSSGTTIAKGKVVYINGADGTNPTIALSDADSESTSSKTLGFTETSSNNGDQVNVVIYGRITNIDTSGAATEGVSVWLSSTAGDYVFGNPPAKPAHAVYLGVVTKKNVSTGEIFVKVQNGYEIEELHNVNASSPTNGDVLQYNSTSGMWEKESLSSAGIASSGHDHSGVYDPAGTTSTHAALTTTVHGITDTANLVYTSDSRLSDARTPSSTLAHASTHLSGGTDELSGISPSQITGTAVVTADSRLSDARTPTAHKTSHSTGGSDALVASDIGAAATSHSHATSDITSGNFVATVSGGTGVTVTGGTGNASTPTVSIGQAVATTSDVTFADITGTGVFSAPNIASGLVLMTPVANTTTGVAVTGLSVLCSNATAALDDFSVAVTANSAANALRTTTYSTLTFSGSTLTGLTVRVFRTDTTQTGVSWIVIGR